MLVMEDFTISLREHGINVVDKPEYFVDSPRTYSASPSSSADAGPSTAAAGSKYVTFAPSGTFSNRPAETLGGGGEGVGGATS